MAAAAIIISVLSALAITLPPSVICQTCNAASFSCPSTTSFEDCLGGTTPSAPTNACPIGTFCDASCSSPCLESVPCSDKMCNSEAFYCTGENPYDFLTCTADSSVPYPDVQTCMPNTVCSMFCPLPCWETPCPECKENGRVPVPGNESNYYLCIVVEGSRPIYEEYACPSGAIFDAATAKCMPTGQAETTVSSPTTTATIPTTTATTPTTTATTPTTTATTPTTTATTPTTTATTPTTTATTLTTTATTPTTTATTPTTTATTPTTTATTPTTTATTPTTTPTTAMASSTTTSGVPVCTVAGKMKDPANCKNYYICSAVSGGGFLQSPYTCPGESNFDPVTLKCSLLTTCTTTTSATSTTITAAVSTTTTATTTTPTTTPTTTTTTKPGFVCPTATGKFADPADCAKYYMCSGSVAYPYVCPGESLFDPTTAKCSLVYVCPV